MCLCYNESRNSKSLFRKGGSRAERSEEELEKKMGEEGERRGTFNDIYA